MEINYVFWDNAVKGFGETSGVADILGISLGLMRQLDSPMSLQVSLWPHLGKEGLAGPWGPGHPLPSGATWPQSGAAPSEMLSLPSDRLQVHTWDLLGGNYSSSRKRSCAPLEWKGAETTNRNSRLQLRPSSQYKVPWIRKHCGMGCLLLWDASYL